MISTLRKLKSNMCFKYKAIIKWGDTIKRVYQIWESYNQAFSKVYHM